MKKRVKPPEKKRLDAGKMVTSLTTLM